MLDNFLSAMTAYGLLPGTPVADDEIHRCPVNGKKGVDGWYRAKIVNDRLYATYGRWDLSDHWQEYPDNGVDPPKVDLEIMAMLRRKAAAEKIEKNKQAALKAFDIFNESEPVTLHKYLTTKKIKPHIARIFENYLVVPIYNKNSELVNLQKIFPDGKKLFLYGGEKKGCAAFIHGDDAICICEGFATGASIHEATGHSIAIAFDAGNLIPAAENIREKYPDRPIIIAADNDHSRKDGNIGIEKGKIAAGKINAELRYPVGCSGTDYNDLACECGLDAVREIINRPADRATAEDLNKQQSDISLQIPRSLIDNHGLITEGLEACKNSDLPDIIQYNYPVILSLICRAIAGTIQWRTLWPSLYNIKVGGTSTGKTDVDRFVRQRILAAKMPNFFGPTSFASGPGLQRAMAQTGAAQTLVMVDEITYLFKRFDRPDPNSEGIIKVLLEMFTQSGQESNRAYGDATKSISIIDPCLVLLGNATQNIFDDIRQKDMENGTMQRFDFWTYDGPIPYRKISQDNYAQYFDNFVFELNRIFTSCPTYKPATGVNMAQVVGSTVDLNFEPQLLNRLTDYSRSITDASNAETDRGNVGIQSRRWHAAIKYAMIHHAATNVENIYSDIGSRSLDYGIELAQLLADWKIKTLSQKINQSDFEKDCKLFIGAISACVKTNVKPTGKALGNRKAAIKGLRPQRWDEIVKALKAQDLIEVVEDRGKTVYYLRK